MRCGHTLLLLLLNLCPERFDCILQRTQLLCLVKLRMSQSQIL